MADEIIVNSRHFKKSLKEILNLNSTVIYNPANKIKLKRKKNNHKFLKLVNVGRLTDQKNHLLLLNAVKNLDKKIDWKLNIIGQGNNILTIKNFIKKYKLTDNIKLLGYKKNPIKYMADADLFVLTSNYEGLPNVLIEAQQIGLPIISTNCKTGPKEILLNGKLGSLVPVGNVKKLTNKIEDFFYNKKKYKKKSNLAKLFLYRFDYK